MNLFGSKPERLPMVWFLLGLLLNAVGLYIGFDHVVALVMIIVGWFCCAFGLALYVLQRMEKPKAQAATRLSPSFISAGDTSAMPAIQEDQEEQVNAST